MTFTRDEIIAEMVAMEKAQNVHIDQEIRRSQGIANMIAMAETYAAERSA